MLPSLRPLSGAVALALLAASAVVAAPPASAETAGVPSTVYKACANKKTGAIRLLTKKKCKKSETKLTWNSPGPAGPTGAAGANGATGQTGARGPSNAYVAKQAGMTTVSVGSPATIASVSLPAGKYVMSGSVQVQNNSTSATAGPRCAIYQDATAVSEFNVANLLFGSGSNGLSLLVFTLRPDAWIDSTAPVTASLRCDAINGSYYALNGTLTAVQVETLTTS